ncbi:MAG: carboxypeptidase-like regulatory domain-containing protein, partial [Bryobacteraceae bacterium]
MLAAGLSAQMDQGTITGVVQDTSGGLMPNVQVTLTNTDTGLVLQTRTNANGLFIFSPVKIGRYKTSAAAPGFQTTVQENLRLNIQQRLNVVMTLNPGAVSETVTVTATPPLLQSQSSSVGMVMSTNT